MRIVFHYPLPLNDNAKSASGIRPVKMLRAFREAGIDVDVVAGFGAERSACIKKVKDNIKNGVVYDFVYSESSTMPTTLTEPHHLPTHPFLDFYFFLFCKKKHIPIGLFYRDIYWCFNGYAKQVGCVKALISKFFYKYDLLAYELLLDKLYLPSLEMGKYIKGFPRSLVSSLPPAHDVGEDNLEFQRLRCKDEPLRIFYVGGVSEHYQMHKLFKVVSRRNDVELTICTRGDEWDKAKKDYPDATGNIRVVHESGSKMQAILAGADIVSVFVKPHKYWEFAAPVKLYEYLGYGKPVIATQGTLTGSFVKKNGIGWALPYEEGALDELLDDLLSSVDTLTDLQHHVRYVSRLHTWKARVNQVVKDLSS